MQWLWLCLCAALGGMLADVMLHWILDDPTDWHAEMERWQRRSINYQRIAQTWKAEARAQQDRNLLLERQLAEALQPTAPSLAVVERRMTGAWTDEPVVPADRWAPWELN